ncbi:hypothetical protein D3C86_1203400 [compost metagenome]
MTINRQYFGVFQRFNILPCRFSFQKGIQVTDPVLLQGQLVYLFHTGIAQVIGTHCSLQDKSNGGRGHAFPQEQTFLFDGPGMKMPENMLEILFR